MKKKLIIISVFALSCIFVLSLASCKKTVIVDGKVIVSNECGLPVDVFIYGVFKTSVEYEDTGTIDNLEDGPQELEARRKGTGEFVARESVMVRFNAIYTWTVLSSARIKIINNYGETLNLYGDDIFVGELSDQNDATLENVPYGERNLVAKTSDDTVVSTTTVSVLADNLYEWTVIK